MIGDLLKKHLYNTDKMCYNIFCSNKSKYKGLIALKLKILKEVR